jgi:hypothetical protein
MDNLKGALNSAVSITTGSISNTMAIADTAVKAASKIAGTTVNAAGVLGDAAVKAAETIGTTALTAGTDVTKTALGVGADVTGKTLTASATIANAATQATADIAEAALQTSASTVTTTTEQVGNALKAGVTLAGNTTTSTLKGLDNIRAMVSGRGEIITTSTLQKQGAELQGVSARKSTDVKKELLKTLEQVQNQITATLSTIDGVQKTSLTAQMNVYKRAKCGFFRRITGTCDSKTISNDIKATAMFLNDFKTTLNNAYSTAKIAISAMPVVTIEAYQTIENEYTSAAATAVEAFTNSYKVLLDKYNKLTREALGMAGGRKKKKTRRAKKVRATRRR